MSICPHCQAENASGATSCQACGKPLATATPSGGLPLWLRALNPEGQAEEDTVVAQANTPTPIDGTKGTGAAAKMPPVAAAAAAPPTEAAQAAHEQATVRPTAESERVTPSFAMPTTTAGGTDTVIATQPTAGARSSGPPTTTAPTNETASLISEDDLPSWLRAFSEPERDSKTTTDDDQSWMLGNSTTINDEQEASGLAQSWQSLPRATAIERPSAAAIFAAPTASPTNVTKHERLITPIVPPPVAQQPATVPSPQAGAATGVPVRLGAGRPVPAIPTRAASSVQRIAIIAFLAALLVFLVVLAIFVVAPALRG